MANLEITIKDGMFTEANGAVKSFTPKKIVGMGWLVKINEDGSLEAISKEKGSEGEFSIRTVLKPGLFLETKRLTMPDGKYRKLGRKEHKIPGIDGILGLSDGSIENRYTYHINKGLINFKKSFAIEKIINKNPNQVYDAPIDSVIYTDGKCSKQIIDNNNCLLDVKDSSWVIIETAAEESKEYKSRILYTQKVHNRLELPKVLSSSGRAEIIRSLEKEFNSVGEAFEYVETTLKPFKKRMYDFEDYAYDEIKVKAVYYLTSEGILNVFLSRTTIWNSRDSLESTEVDMDFVTEGKDYFYKTDRILEGLSYVE